MTQSKWIERFSLFGVVALATALLAIFTFSHSARETAAKVLVWFDQRGAWGMLLYIGMYVIAVVLLVPAVILTLGAGFVFGFWGGMLVVVVSVAISAPAAFLLARHAFGGRIENRLKRHPRLQIINRGLRKEGWKIVLLSRLIPGFPFKLSNYFFGLTEIPLRGFCIGTMVGVLPLTIVNVYVGTLVGRVAELVEREPEPWEWLLSGLGLLAMIALVYQLTGMARAAIRRATEEEEREKG